MLNSHNRIGGTIQTILLDFSVWGKETIGCEFWYALIVVTVNPAILFALMWLAK